MWKSEDTFQRILEDALLDVPYAIAARVIGEKLSGQGVQLTEREREELAEHLKTTDDAVWSPSDASTDVQVRVEITDADIQVVLERVEDFMSEHVPRIIVTVGEQVAGQILGVLHETWEGEAESQRLERHDFEERLGTRWGRPISLLRMLLTVARESGDLANTLLRSSEERESAVTAGVLLRLHARACQVTDEIACLMAAEFADGAMARWRTLHEIAAVALFLREYGDPAAQRYADHEVIESARAARDYDECCERLGYDPMSQADLDEIHQAHEDAVAKYGPSFNGPYGWSADALGLKRPTLRDVQAAVGIDHMKSYYRLASHNVHANPKGVFFKLGLLGDADVLLAGPSNVGLSDPGQNAAISLTQVCSALGTLQPTMDTMVVLTILNRLTNEVCEAFHAAREKLERDAREGA